MSILGVSSGDLRRGRCTSLANAVNSKIAIEDLELAGFIDPESPTGAVRVQEGLQYNYSREKEPVFEEIEPKTYEVKV